jgi:hypothetical protein
MMKSLLFSLAFSFSLAGFSQDKPLSTFTQGAKMQFTGQVNSREIKILITLDSVSSDFTKIGWNVEGYGAGSWIMKKNSLENSKRGVSGNPEPGVDQVLPDEESAFLLSKAQWTSIQNEKKVSHDGVNYTVVTPTENQLFKLGDKGVDAVLLESENKSTRMWIANNPVLPIIMKVEGNPTGVDLTLQSIN